MTVASMPIMSPVTRGMPCSRDFDAAKDIAAADHDADGDAERLGGDEIGRDALERRLMDAESVRAAQRFAGDLHDDAPVGGFGHGMLLRSDRRRKRRDTANAWVGTPLKKCSGRFDQGGDLAAEITLRPVDAFAERVAHEARRP